MDPDALESCSGMDEMLNGANILPLTVTFPLSKESAFTGSAVRENIAKIRSFEFIEILLFIIVKGLSEPTVATSQIRFKIL